MPSVDAASNTMTLALSASLVLVALFGSAIIFFWRERSKAREKKESLLERRLQSGIETMQSLKSDIKENSSKLLDAVTGDQFNGYCKEHNHCHEFLEKKITDLQISMTEMQADFRAVGARVEQSVGILTSLMSKTVWIPSLQQGPKNEPDLSGNR